jgi:site-specific DNA-adenine methylase
LDLKAQFSREQRNKKEDQLQQLERLEQLLQLERLEQLPAFTITNLDFQDVKIETPLEETIIYLDPPYRGTAEYKESALFDDIDNYFRNSPYTCFMSEYNAPFESVLEIRKESLMNNSNLNERKYVIEKLYWNKK